MANDGGLHNVLQTSERISDCLFSLSQHDGHRSGDTTSAGVKRKPSRSLSEISGNTDRSIRMDLAQHTSAELNKVVAPLIKELENLDASALLSLNPSKDGRGATLDPLRGLTVPPIHDLVSPPYSYRNGGPNIVRYLHVKEVPHKYSVGIFIFPPHGAIPLHDHPDMVVISRILYGSLEVQSYDVLPDNGNIDHNDNSDRKKRCNDRTLATSSSSKPPSALRRTLNKMKDLVSPTMLSYKENEDVPVDSVLHVKPNQDDKNSPLVISAPTVTCLYPHEGNCHAFVAGPNGAAVLDVLLPPYYADDDRDCTFYDGSSADKQSSSCTLTPIDQPSDFHCIGGSYGRFGECEEDSSDEDPEDDGKMSTSCNLS